MPLSLELIEKLKNFRQELHQYPELSGQENQTAQKIQNLISQFHPDRLIPNLGKTGLAVIYESKEPGLTLAFRGDIDALPIEETNSFAYRSKNLNICHACGHDGHATIITSLAAILHQNPIQTGKVVLLFQPAEETGTGAKAIIADERFQQLKIDYLFGLHNLPQYPLGQILLKPGVFSAASKGLKIKLQGATSHAAYPEDGISPALAMAKIIAELTQLPQQDGFKDFVLVTVVYARLGEIAFGTSPGDAEVMATLRSYQNSDMETLTDRAIALIEAAATTAQLKYEITWTEEFSATVNHPDALAIVKQAAIDRHCDWVEIDKPFRWSEDFGQYTRQYKGAFFGLGAGENQPQLHNSNYDFPDELIECGANLFSQIVLNLLGHRTS